MRGGPGLVREGLHLPDLLVSSSQDLETGGFATATRSSQQDTLGVLYTKVQLLDLAERIR